MTTLKENITKKFEFDEEKSRNNSSGNPTFNTGARWQLNQLKNEVLPILLECVEALDDIVDAPGDDSFMIAKQALERLRKWSEEK